MKLPKSDCCDALASVGKQISFSEPSGWIREVSVCGLCGSECEIEWVDVKEGEG